MQYHPSTYDYRQFQRLPKMRVGAQKALCWATSEAIGEAQRMQDIIGHDTPWAPLFELAIQPSYRPMIVEFLNVHVYSMTGRPTRGDERPGAPTASGGIFHSFWATMGDVVAPVYGPPRFIPQAGDGHTFIHRGTLIDPGQRAEALVAHDRS
ncbi:hypothetical protein HanRHA438_Chr16g0765911 [Helianthus annuus]|nr:hypothetical protein HanRHA438_Chr16g0765911 [Helianthus annuus]